MNPKEHTCWTCGYTFKHGEDGTHSCENILMEENSILRELLWLRHGCEMKHLYGDDGEMQCSRCSLDRFFLRPLSICR